MSFVKKVVLITGGSAGIGATTAEFFAKEGASVAIVGRNEAKLNAVAQRCQKLGVPTLSIKADVAKDEEADTIVKKTIDKFGRLDVLVNNAGILREANILSDKFLSTYDEVMNVNMRGTIRITHFAAPHLIKTKGNIVNVSSIAGKCTARPNNIAYRTSKAAMTHFTRCVALEMAPHGVRVNSVSPGPVKTDIFDGLEVTEDALTNMTALHRLSETSEIADMIVYVASDKAKGTTGSDYVVDNGCLLR
ncbi:3-oxoacyl-[acyl-carrier-protein] reductase FabG [Helicoverpa armigera]|uniref:3-oxoacyl-[acyl-carrier-protein] reductase FabG n=1 Tax=Helicoverpa armigera TaxID=29058 RepID=UPI003083CB6F